MTHVTFDISTLELRAEGHAGSGKDFDEACCAVSTLMFTLAQALDEYGIDAVGEGEEGGDYLVIRSEEMGSLASVIYGTIFAGMQLIAEKYPEYIELEIR